MNWKNRYKDMRKVERQEKWTDQRCKLLRWILDHDKNVLVWVVTIFVLGGIFTGAFCIDGWIFIIPFIFWFGLLGFIAGLGFFALFGWWVDKKGWVYRVYVRYR